MFNINIRKLLFSRGLWQFFKMVLMRFGEYLILTIRRKISSVLDTNFCSLKIYIVYLCGDNMCVHVPVLNMASINSKCITSYLGHGLQYVD